MNNFACTYSSNRGRRKGDAEGANAESILGKLHHLSQILREIKKFEHFLL